MPALSWVVTICHGLGLRTIHTIDNELTKFFMGQVFGIVAPTSRQQMYNGT
jgi:hypothetical protein